MQTKDLFSGHASLYATFRPTYPKSFFDFMLSKTTHVNLVWNCATGNGQVARHLSGHFQQVEATDISEQQLGRFRHPTSRTEFRLQKKHTSPITILI